MSRKRHVEEHPDFAAMGIMAGYGEYDEQAMAESCAHIAIVSISDTETQCMDCLRTWPKEPGFRSDWPQYDRG
jgi:hypothetical protein